MSSKHPLPCALLAASSLIEATCYTQTTKSSEWQAAMDSEFTSLQSIGTWILVPPEPHMNVVGCKWVYLVKHNPDGLVS